MEVETEPFVYPTDHPVLVCGGAGYVGSHVCRALLQIPKLQVIIVDDLSKGHQSNIDALKATIPGEEDRLKFKKLDMRNLEALQSVFALYWPRTVFNFSGSIEVGESMKDPIAFFANNCSTMTNLLSCVQTYRAHHVIFSSTAAVYGTPDSVPIPEDAQLHPENAYGETKLACERMLHWMNKCSGITSVCLRYFNACGASPAGDLGENHSPESHLIPIVLSVAAGLRENVKLFGTDYDTPDGTCVRDYVHVNDLASAHVLAWKYLVTGGETSAFNLGNGIGFSVKEVVETARKVTGHAIPALEAERRSGDPAKLVASAEKAHKVLGWKPEFADLTDIISTAWKWGESLWQPVEMSALMHKGAVFGMRFPGRPGQSDQTPEESFIVSAWRPLPDGEVSREKLRPRRPIVDEENPFGTGLPGGDSDEEDLDRDKVYRVKLSFDHSKLLEVYGRHDDPELSAIKEARKQKLEWELPPFGTFVLNVAMSTIHSWEAAEGSSLTWGSNKLELSVTLDCTGPIVADKAQLDEYKRKMGWALAVILRDADRWGQLVLDGAADTLRESYNSGWKPDDEPDLTREQFQARIKHPCHLLNVFGPDEDESVYDWEPKTFRMWADDTMYKESGHGIHSIGNLALGSVTSVGI